MLEQAYRKCGRHRVPLFSSDTHTDTALLDNKSGYTHPISTTSPDLVAFNIHMYGCSRGPRREQHDHDDMHEPLVLRKPIDNVASAQATSAVPARFGQI